MDYLILDKNIPDVLINDLFDLILQFVVIAPNEVEVQWLHPMLYVEYPHFYYPPEVKWAEGILPQRSSAAAQEHVVFLKEVLTAELLG